MLGKRTFVGLLFAAILAQPAMAAPATEEGAGKLLATFQMYLGKLADSEKGSLTVKPDGEAYLVSFDLGAALKPFEGAGFKIEPAVISTHIAAEEDGTYHVSDLKLPPLVVNAKDTKIAYSFEGVSFDGVFDPKIGGFTKSDVKFGKVAYEQVAANATVHVTESDIVGQQTSTPIGAGVATVQQHYVIGGITETISGGGGKDQVNVAFGNTSADVNIAGLKNQAIWDIWAFVVAHAGQDKLAAGDVGTLKSQAMALLPVFDKLDETVKFTDFGVDTPMGKFTLGELGFKAAASGAVESGTYTLSLSGAKPGYPSGMLQPWQANLVPTEFSIGADFAGLNLNAAAKQLISDFDPAAKDPLTPAAMDKAMEVMWAGGPMKVTFAPSHITAPMYQVQMSGDATISRSGPPTLHVVVTAKGVDATMDALAAAKQTDPNAGQAVLMLATAKGLGKGNPDGTVAWDIQLGADGSATVNGAKLK